MKFVLKKYILFISFFAVLISACKKKNEDLIPAISVDIYLYSYEPAFFNLNPVGGWTYINGGIKGILVYRKTNTEFLSFERNSTYKPSDGCTITVDSTSNLFVDDKCSGSRFLISDGSVVKGPASLPLKQYRNSWDGNILHIFN